MLSIIIYALITFTCSATWVEKTAMPTRRSDHACDAVDSMVYVCGGCEAVKQDFQTDCTSVSSRCDKYDSTTNAWTRVADMPRARTRHATAVVGTKLYLIGGVDQAGASSFAEVDVYDTLTDTWSTPVEFQMSAQYSQYTDQSAFTIGTDIYTVGGYNLTDFAYTTHGFTHKLDTTATTNAWSYLVATQIHARGDMCTLEYDGAGYTMGGWAYGDFCTPRDDVEKFSANTWVEQHKQPVASNHVPDVKGDSACVAVGNLIFTIGGEQKDSACNVTTPLAVTESYDPAADKWSNHTEMTLLHPRFRFCAVAIGYDLYVFGGQGAFQTNAAGEHWHEVLNDVEAFSVDPSSVSVADRRAPFLVSVVLLLLAVVNK